MPSTEASQRAAVVAEARAWLRTPYHNCADIKGAGVDCGMLLVRVFVDSGLCEPFDPRPYAPDWHFHRDGERYLGFVFDHCAEVQEAQAQPGDVVVFKLGHCYSHGGIITAAKPLSLIHSYWPARMVIEEPLALNLNLCQPTRARKYFSYWKKS